MIVSSLGHNNIIICVFSWSDYYSDILKHKELKGCIKTASLGFLLSQEDLNLLEDQYLADKEVKTKCYKGPQPYLAGDSTLSSQKIPVIPTFTRHENCESFTLYNNWSLLCDSVHEQHFSRGPNYSSCFHELVSDNDSYTVPFSQCFLYSPEAIYGCWSCQNKNDILF